MSRVLPYNAKQWEIPLFLDGRRSVARLVLKPPFEIHPNGYITKPKGNERLCPYEPPYQPGDILYVRETWNRLPYTGDYIYKADDKDNRNIPKGEVGHIIWRPSIHMPKEAARIWLKVTNVRVERLQDMDDHEAYKEGAGEKKAIYYIGARKCEFAKLWDSTIKKSDLDRYGWNANPWVWVIEFERCEKPESWR